jgi:hypothetical protein
MLAFEAEAAWALLPFPSEPLVGIDYPTRGLMFNAVNIHDWRLEFGW